MPHRSRTFTRYIRLGCAAVALAAAYACDARTPTAPAPARTPMPLRGDESEGALFGSIDLAPATPFSQFGTIPENKWALIRVSGQWMVRPNPACADQPPNWPCITTDAYSGFAADYPDAFAGPVRVATFSPTGSLDDVPLRAFGGPDEGVGLTQRPFSRSVFAGPVLRNPTVPQFGTTGLPVPSYIITGSYSVTVTEIASPVRVTEGAAAADGSRTYTVEPLYGLQLINPLGSFDPPGAVRWFFVPGEDVDPTAPNSDPPWTIGECRNQTSCTWTPPGPGRVQVSVFVETQRARARSTELPACQNLTRASRTGAPRSSLVAGDGCAQEPKLVLKCNDQRDALTLVRVETITCTPETEPAGAAIAISGWKFTGTGGYTYPGADDPPETGEAWSGPMVMSGKVEVTARVGTSTAEQTASVEVTVTPRTERPDDPNLFTLRQGTLDDIEPDRRSNVPPRNQHDLGMIQFTRQTFASEDPALAATYLGFVTDGPNTHLAYLTRVPARVSAVVAVNPEMRVGSDFYRRQAHSYEVVTRTCVQESWQRYISLILHHEGYPINEESHAGYYRKQLYQDAWPAVEDIVRPDNELGQMKDDWKNRLVPVFAAANAKSQRVDQEHPVPFNCTFTF